MRNAGPAAPEGPGRPSSLPRGQYLVIAAGFLAGAVGGLLGFFSGGPVSKWFGLAGMIAAIAGGIMFVVLLISQRRRLQGEASRGRVPLA